MGRRGVLALFASLLIIQIAPLCPRTAAATDDVNLTGLIYLGDGTTLLSGTPWSNNTSFAILVNHVNNWSNAWRYPPTPLWLTTSFGAYSAVLPAAQKDLNWSTGDWYRVEIDASSMLGNPMAILNATSHGTGDPGKFTPTGYQNNSIVWSSSDNWQRWDVVVGGIDLVPNAVAFAGMEFTGPYQQGVPLGPVDVLAGQQCNVSANVSNLGAADDTLPTTIAFYDVNATTLLGSGSLAGIPAGSVRPTGWRFNATWTAPQMTGYRYIDVIVDYFNNVTETRKDNNAVRIWARVSVPGKPDYVPSVPLPASPVHAGLGEDVQLSAKVSNIGGGNATLPTTIAFYNETSPGAPFNASQVPPLNAGQSSARFSATWTAPTTSCIVSVTVAVDYASVLVEENESNNFFTWTIVVTRAPTTSLVIGQPNYSAAMTYVTSSTPFDFLAVDQSGTGILNTTYRVDGGQWENYTATGRFFLSSEGDHAIEWYSTDFAGNVESANSRQLRVDDTPPITSLVIGDPKYLVGGSFVISSTPLTLTATDGGITPVGVDLTDYRVDGGSWRLYSGVFHVTAEGSHTIDMRSSDRLGNMEAVRSLLVIVDNTPPATMVSVGQPKHQTAKLYVTSTTQINLTAVDGGVVPVGLATIEYRVDGGSWRPYSSPFNLTGQEGARTVQYRSADLLGNAEPQKTLDVVMDNTPPITSIILGRPRYLVGGAFVNSSTTLTLLPIDGGADPVGVNATRFRIWNTTWSAWSIYGVPFRLTGQDGRRYVEFVSDDLLDNQETMHNVTIVLDNSPPVTAISPSTGNFTANTTFTLTASDSGCGLNRTEYGIDNGSWMNYSGGFNLTEGFHNITYRSADKLGNQEAEHRLQVYIRGGTKPPDNKPPQGEANYKPVVAVTLAIILFVVGLWSSKRKPWKGGKERMAVVKAFMIISFPFILAEAATGIVSLLTGQLSIPPSVGLGTAVDIAILVVGLAVQGLRSFRPEQSSVQRE